MVDDVRRLHTERASDLSLDLRLERTRAAQRWCSELEARPIATDANEPDAALLKDHGLLPRLAALRQPGVACAKRGVPGKGQLTAGRKDAHAIVRLRILRRQEECRFGQIGPAR